VIIVFGMRDLGVLDRTAHARIGTTFFALFFVFPLFPMASFVEDEGGRRTVPLQLRSVLAAYLRAYALPIGFAPVASWWPSPLMWRLPGPWLIAALGVAAFAFASLALGRLGTVEQRKRAAWAEVTGTSLPPELWPDGMVETLGHRVVDATGRHGETYRHEPPGDDEIARVLKESDEAALLASALAWSRATGRANLEAAAWARLESLERSGKGTSVVVPSGDPS